MTESAHAAVPRRRWGKSGLSIPVIPFGSQGFGDNFGPVADEEAAELVHRAIVLGVNHFDCARCYGDSLRKLGIALRDVPRRPHECTISRSADVANDVVATSFATSAQSPDPQESHWLWK